MFQSPRLDLPQLLDLLQPDAPMAERHLWLIHLCEWIRGDARSTEAAMGRVRLLLDTLDADAHARQRLQAWWTHLVDAVDITALLADFGFAPRTAFFSEFSAPAHQAAAAQPGDHRCLRAVRAGPAQQL